MTTEAPWMRVFTRDWLARTGGLTPSDKGILSDLNAIMHERGAPVVFNEKLLAARCRATPKSFAKSVDTLIEAGLVSLEDGFLWSEDMQRQIEFQEKKSVNGKSAAKKRHEKNKQNQSSASADAMPYQMQNIEDDPHKGDHPSSTSSFDKSDAREANKTDHRSASSSGLDGRTDASRALSHEPPVAVFLDKDDPEEFFDTVGGEDLIRCATEAAAAKLLDAFVRYVEPMDARAAMRRKLDRLLKVGELTWAGFMSILDAHNRQVRNG